jgi:hypothetical protein
MCVAEALSMTGFACYTTLLPTLMKAWDLNNSQAGLIGGVFYAGYMLAVPVLSSLTDRVDSRRIYVGACLLSAVGAAGFALLAQGLAGALFFQFLIGAGLGGTYMPGLKTLTDHLEGKAQSRATAYYTASFGVGSTISIIASGKIALLFGWQWAFVFGATGPVAAALLVIGAMPPGRSQSAHAHSPALLDFRPVVKNRATMLYVLGYSAHNYELFGQRSDGGVSRFRRHAAIRRPAARGRDARRDDQHAGPGDERHRQRTCAAVRPPAHDIPVHVFVRIDRLRDRLYRGMAVGRGVRIDVRALRLHARRFGSADFGRDRRDAAAAARRDDGGVLVCRIYGRVSRAAGVRRGARSRRRQPQRARVGSSVREHRNFRRVRAACTLDVPQALKGGYLPR